MKLKHFYVSVCMVLVSILSINAQTSVTLTQAGTLSSKLPASEADRAKINELIINGPLNGADIYHACLCAFALVAEARG